MCFVCVLKMGLVQSSADKRKKDNKSITLFSPIASSSFHTTKVKYTKVAPE